MDLKKLRVKSGLTQAEFWNKLGITQSGGSRYEGGRRLPRSLQKLLVLATGTERQAKAEYARLRG